MKRADQRLTGDIRIVFKFSNLWYHESCVFFNALSLEQLPSTLSHKVLWYFFVSVGFEVAVTKFRKLNDAMDATSTVEILMINAMKINSRHSL